MRLVAEEVGDSTLKVRRSVGHAERQPCVLVQPECCGEGEQWHSAGGHWGLMVSHGHVKCSKVGFVGDGACKILHSGKRVCVLDCLRIQVLVVDTQPKLPVSLEGNDNRSRPRRL